MAKQRVGIVGYGHLGQFLTKAILQDPVVAQKLELAFVWNRTSSALTDVPADLQLQRLEDFADRSVVCSRATYAHCGSGTPGNHARVWASLLAVRALSDQRVETMLRDCAAQGHYGLYIPVGALWGALDIQRMSERGSLTALTVTMKKAPHHMRLGPPLDEALASAEARAGETVIYEGSVRDLCPLAPNNVNTMAAAALAAASLGFDKVQARLVADSTLDRHVVEVDVRGPNGFRVTSERSNPAAKGAVTGQATYGSFLSSLLAAGQSGNGLHLC